MSGKSGDARVKFFTWSFQSLTFPEFPFAGNFPFHLIMDRRSVHTTRNPRCWTTLTLYVTYWNSSILLINSAWKQAEIVQLTNRSKYSCACTEGPEYMNYHHVWCLIIFALLVLYFYIYLLYFYSLLTNNASLTILLVVFWSQFQLSFWRDCNPSAHTNCPCPRKLRGGGAKAMGTSASKAQSGLVFTPNQNTNGH